MTKLDKLIKKNKDFIRKHYHLSKYWWYATMKNDKENIYIFNDAVASGFLEVSNKEIIELLTNKNKKE